MKIRQLTLIAAAVVAAAGCAGTVNVPGGYGYGGKPTTINNNFSPTNTNTNANTSAMAVPVDRRIPALPDRHDACVAHRVDFQEIGFDARKPAIVTGSSRRGARVAKGGRL